MRIDRLGERAVIVRNLPCPAYALANALNRGGVQSMLEAVASYETVGLFFSEPPELPDLEERIRRVLSTVDLTRTGTRHEVPVCYELGEDLDASALRLGISAEELTEIHLAHEFLCHAVGFSPGFPYLGYLPESVSIPRLASPRTRVEPGSVGIAGRQTAVYPSMTPGGWNLIGRCPLTLVDVADDYFPISAGDSVQFVRVDVAEFERLRGERL